MASYGYFPSSLGFLIQRLVFSSKVGRGREVLVDFVLEKTPNASPLVAKRRMVAAMRMVKLGLVMISGKISDDCNFGSRRGRTDSCSRGRICGIVVTYTDRREQQSSVC